MSHQNQPKQSGDPTLEMILILVGVLLAWPALLLGAAVRSYVSQRVSNPFLYRIAAGVFGTGGAWILFADLNPTPSMRALFNDTLLAVHHLTGGIAIHVLLDALSIWGRSVLLFPIAIVMLELFTPQRFERTLVTRERQRRTLQTRKATRAARKVQNAPLHIKGKAVLGALIDNPNDYA